jgi:hypothetical protein
VRVTEDVPNGRSVVLGLPMRRHILIRAGVRHRIEALEDGTEFWCVYAHRDAQGRVSQVYTGWMDAYS